MSIAAVVVLLCSLFGAVALFSRVLLVLRLLRLDQMASEVSHEQSQVVVAASVVECPARRSKASRLHRHKSVEGEERSPNHNPLPSTTL